MPEALGHAIIIPMQAVATLNEPREKEKDIKTKVVIIASDDNPVPSHFDGSDGLWHGPHEISDVGRCANDANILVGGVELLKS